MPPPHDRRRRRRNRRRLSAVGRRRRRRRRTREERERKRRIFLKKCTLRTISSSLNPVKTTVRTPFLTPSAFRRCCLVVVVVVVMWSTFLLSSLLFAKSIHYFSTRRARVFLCVNVCRAIFEKNQKRIDVFFVMFYYFNSGVHTIVVANFAFLVLNLSLSLSFSHFVSLCVCVSTRSALRCGALLYSKRRKLFYFCVYGVVVLFPRQHRLLYVLYSFHQRELISAFFLQGLFARFQPGLDVTEIVLRPF